MFRKKVVKDVFIFGIIKETEIALRNPEDGEFFFSPAFVIINAFCLCKVQASAIITREEIRELLLAGCFVGRLVKYLPTTTMILIIIGTMR